MYCSAIITTINQLEQGLLRQFNLFRIVTPFNPLFFSYSNPMFLPGKQGQHPSYRRHETFNVSATSIAGVIAIIEPLFLKFTGSDAGIVGRFCISLFYSYRILAVLITRLYSYHFAFVVLDYAVWQNKNLRFCNIFWLLSAITIRDDVGNNAKKYSEKPPFSHLKT
ncbi:MAG: hypothetical protein NTV00_11515 [Methylococcales bacterium]|nr:hypothetical protein [Methylococcales bacterium]